MEQGNCLDSTLMSARQEVDVRSGDEPALGAAITGLLQAPTGGTASEPVSTALPQAGLLDLADACIEQVARLDLWDANPGSLIEAQGDAEMERWEAVFRRAIETPSAGLRDLAGKAHLMLADLERFHPLQEESTDDARLMRVILAETMQFGGLATQTSTANVALRAARPIKAETIEPDLPPPMPGEWHANSPTPELFALVSEWITIDAEVKARPMDDDELDATSHRIWVLHELICTFEARCFEDMQMKTALYRREAREARGPKDAPPSMAETAWLSVVRDIEALGRKQPIRGLGIYDPAFLVIEEGRRLLRANLDAYHIYEQDPSTLDPRPEWRAAGHALDRYLKETLLRTVPLTAGACRELARFAVEYAEAMECQILDGDDEVIARLIAQSPMLDEGTKHTKAGLTFTLAKAEAEGLGLSALSINELSVFYDKLKVARELWGAAMCEPVAVASRCTDGFVVRSHYGSRAEYEDVRADFLMDRIATEIANRPAIDEFERNSQLAVRIQQEIACEGRILNPALLADIARVWG